MWVEKLVSVHTIPQIDKETLLFEHLNVLELNAILNVNLQTSFIASKKILSRSLGVFFDSLVSPSVMPVENGSPSEGRRLTAVFITFTKSDHA